MRGKVMIVDDDPTICNLLEKGLNHRGFQTTSRNSADEAFLAIGGEDFDAVLTDLNLEGMSGIDLCQRITANRPDLPVILITGFASLDSAVAAMRAGAYDFIAKPVELEGLAHTLDRALRLRSLREEVKRLQLAAAGAHRFHELSGESRPMEVLYELVARSAESDASVLISGETGTGKELVARALHRLSRRTRGAFVALNCAAMPEQLLESELFGHIRGAFTDAKWARTGLFLRASSGTLFLDEIGDMPLGLQPKLLRALQERKVRPVGGDIEVPFDVRIIAATNRDLEAVVKEGKFREDLFFRLNVISIEVPPLRARGHDVLLLAHQFIDHFSAKAQKRVSGMTSQVGERLLEYDWPGNVRELQNSMERAVALTGYEKLTVEDLPEKVRNYHRLPSRLPPESQSAGLASRAAAGELPAPDELLCADGLLSMDELERRHILKVLRAVGGNKTIAAQVLGFDRKTLYRKLERYNLKMPGAAKPQNG